MRRAPWMRATSGYVDLAGNGCESGGDAATAQSGDVFRCLRSPYIRLHSCRTPNQPAAVASAASISRLGTVPGRQLALRYLHYIYWVGGPAPMVRWRIFPMIAARVLDEDHVLVQQV